MSQDQLSRAFAALADPTRRDIVARLAVGDATVVELARPYDMTVQAVSKHLKVLEDAGLVSRTRDAQRRPCHLEAEVFDLMTKWIERYRRQAEERFARLDDVLAAMDDGLEAGRPTDGGAGDLPARRTPRKTPRKTPSKTPGKTSGKTSGGRR
jgi:DNA-binding transcriptional ArsR family regulator